MQSTGRITSKRRFEVQLSNLSATATYEVIVASDSAALGIGACGAAAQTRTVTGAATRDLTFIVRACAVGEGTITAEVRRAGASSPAATVSQRLTGFGLLFWRKGDPHPNYANALVKGAAARSHTYTGLQTNTTYQFRIHACNGSGSCGWWTDPPKEVVVPEPPRVTAPGKVRNLRFSTDHESFTVRWDEPSNNGGAAITGYGILQWRDGTRRPAYSAAETLRGRTNTSKRYSGLRANTKYWVTVHACNGPDRCGAWTGNTSVTTDPTPPTPAPTAAPPPTGRPGTLQTVTIANDPAGSASLKATWTVNSTTELTRFQVLRRRDPGTYPQLIQAATVNVVAGQTNYEYSYDGLERLITYRVQVRACTGPNDASDCSGWVESNSLPMPPDIVVPGIPGPVTGVSFANQTAESFTVTWEAPANNGGTDITGYGLQHKRGDWTTPWPPTSQVVVGVTPREWTFRGLWKGTHWVRIQAYNGKNSCYPWTKTVGHSVIIPPPPVTNPIVITAPGQVRDLAVDVGTGQLAVQWRAPTNDGGQDITRYEVAYKEQSLSTWIARDDVQSGTSTTIPIADTTASYDVRVRACNGPDTDDCGTWRQTNSTHGPPPPPVGVPTADCEKALREDEPTISPVGPIVLNLRPLYHPDPQRPGTFTALLTWTLIANAPSYEVQIRKLEPDRWGAWGSRDRRSEYASSLTTDETCMVINLSAIVTTSSGADEGLAHSKAWGFQVRAVNSDGASEYSPDLVLIDNPIVAPNGYSPSGTGQISLQWTSISDIMQPKGSDYSSGNVGFNYRKVLHDTGSGEQISHTQLGWLPYSHSRYGSSPDANGGTVIGNTTTGLSLDKIYAIQFRLDATGPAGTSKVYAARDAYAWTSGSRPRLDDRVATFSMDPDVSKTYVYRICPDGFGDYLTDWQLTIEHAFRQWEITTGGLVRATRTADGCPDFTRVLERAVEAVSMYGPVTDGNRAAIEGHIKSLDRYTGLDAADTSANEIHIVDFDAAPLPNLRDQLAFSELTVNLGVNDCSKYVACVTYERHHESGLRTNDITINKSKGKLDRDPLLVDIDLGAPLSVIEGIYDDIRSTEIVFNTCSHTVFDPRSYAAIVHEAGHAFGLSGFTLSASDRDVWDESLKGHPAIRGSVLTYKNRNLRRDDAAEYRFSSEEGRCAPHPFDVMALYALYQAP